MKEDVLRIPKCLIHEAPDDFWPSYYRSKSERGVKSENVTKIMRRLKKRHGHNYWKLGSTLNQRLRNPLFAALIQRGDEILEIVQVKFSPPSKLYTYLVRPVLDSLEHPNPTKGWSGLLDL